MNWPLIALASIGIFALLVLFLAACALGARADEAGENARCQLPDGAKRFDPLPPEGIPQDALWQPEPEHSHRSALAGRRPDRLGVFAQVGRPGHPPLNSNDR